MRAVLSGFLSFMAVVVLFAAAVHAEQRLSRLSEPKPRHQRIRRHGRWSRAGRRAAAMSSATSASADVAAPPVAVAGLSHARQAHLLRFTRLQRRRRARR